MSWRRWLGGGDDDPLPGLLLAALKRAWPDLDFARAPDDAIEIRCEGEPVLMMSLASVRARAAEQGAAAAVKSWVGDPQVRRALDGATSGRQEAPTFTLEGLVPRFALAARLSAVPAVPAHRVAWPGVWLTVCWHHEDAGAHYLQDEDLATLGLDWEAALARSIDNLDRLWRGALEVSAIPAPSGGPELLVIDDVHAASALLVPGVRARLAGQLGSPFLAMVPQTDELIAAPLEPRSRAEHHFGTAREGFRESAHPVSDRVLRVHAEGFEPES